MRIWCQSVTMVIYNKKMILELFFVLLSVKEKHCFGLKLDGHFVVEEHARISTDPEETVSFHSKSEIACAYECHIHQTCCSATYDMSSSQCTMVVTESGDKPSVSSVGSIVVRKMPTCSATHYKPKDCDDLPVGSGSGVYKIYPNGSSGFQVYCEMDTDGGGWTAFQRRTDGSEDFFRDWKDYKIGFGTLTNEFWLGNDNINRLSSSGNYKLRVELEDFRGSTAFAVYTTFLVDNEESSYKITVQDYQGNASDSMNQGTRKHNGMNFSSKDVDNDISPNHCAKTVSKAGWWFNDCARTNLNGLYLGEGISGTNSIFWFFWRGKQCLKKTTMMMKLN